MTGSGIHAEVKISGSSVCRVVDASKKAEVASVSRSAAPTTDGTTVEFTADSGADTIDASEVFSYDSKGIYRFEQPASEESACACDLIERNGYPTRHTEVDAGAVVLSFVAEDIKSLRDVIAALKTQYDISLQCLTRSSIADDESDLVFVDRSVLTERQREVLETAHEMGYFDHPKQANAAEVAAALDINGSTFAEHVSAAQSKLLESILEE